MQLSFTEKDLKSHLGSTYYQRGATYYKKGMVKKMVLGERAILGQVKGSWSDDYQTIILLNEKGHFIDSDCTCPLGGYCKHVGALGLKALKEVKKEAPEDAWVNQLKKVFSSQTSISQKQKSHAQLMISIQKNQSGRFNPSSMDQWKLVFRPRFFDADTRKYSITTLSWRDVGSSYGPMEEIPPSQADFLRKVRETLGGTGYWNSYSDRWIDPVNLKLDYLWQLLTGHQEYGIELLAGHRAANRVHFSPIPLRAELILKDKKDNLTLGSQFFCDNEAVEKSSFMPVGQPAQFAVRFNDPHFPDNTHLTFYPLQGAKALFDHFKKSVTVPQKQQERFKKEFLPTLVRDYKVVNTSSNITLPQSISPKLKIDVTHKGGNKIHTQLNLMYGEKVFPLSHRPHEVELDNGEVMIANPIEAENKVNELKQKLSSMKLLWNQEKNEVVDQGVLERLQAAHFMNQVIPELHEQDHIDLNLADDLPEFTLEERQPKVEFKVEEGQSDWFDLNISITIGEKTIPFYEVFVALSKNEDHLFLDDGTYFSLNHERFEKLKAMIEESGKIKEMTPKGISMSRFQAGLWEELKKLGLVTQQAEAWEKAMKGLLNFKKIEAKPHSKKLKATLRNYQKEGYQWLNFLYEHQLGGVLADDMGLGKTLQTIALLDYIKEVEKKKDALCLVVGPTSVVESWDIELDRFAPHLKRVVMRAGDRSSLFKKVKKADVVVTSYSLMHRDFEELKKHSFDLMILDEAQHLKNHQSKLYSSARKLEAKVRLALTGTPMENNTLELWSIFSIVAPGLFPSVKQFKDLYQKPIEKEGDKHKLKQLRSRIRPFMVRRKKESVAKDLPSKTEQVLYLEMDKKQRRIYDLHLQRERKRVLGLMKNGGMKQNRFEIFKSLTRMRQLCLHAGLVDEKHANIPSAKLDQLAKQLKELLSKGHRVLIFSQFTSFLAHVRSHLEAENMDYLYLDGSTKNRGELVKKFQSGKGSSIFLISLKAGGSGLTLTAADYCIVLDPWWNPAVEAQAVDRTHRIGQKKKVFVYKMIVKNSIEEKVLKLQEKKKKLFDSVLEEGGKFGSVITEQDIRMIFE